MRTKKKKRNPYWKQYNNNDSTTKNPIVNTFRRLLAARAHIIYGTDSIFFKVVHARIRARCRARFTNNV